MSDYAHLMCCALLHQWRILRRGYSPSRFLPDKLPEEEVVDVHFGTDNDPDDEPDDQGADLPKSHPLLRRTAGNRLRFSPCFTMLFDERIGK